MRDADQLGVRQSVAAFIAFSIAGFGSVFLILVVFALVVARSTDAGPVFDAAGKGMSSVGVGVGASFDELTAIAATVVLGFYVVVLGGQLSVNLDVIALRTSLSLTAVGIACALNVAGLTTIVARFQHPDPIGYSAVVVTECALVSGLAIALTSQILLRRSLQIEQEAASLSRARSDIRRLARRLSGLPRRSNVAAAVPALVIPAVPATALALSTWAVEWVMVVVVLAAATQGAFGLVHYLRASTVLRWTRPIVVVVPTIVGLFVISWALVMLEDDLPVLAVAFAAAFVVPAAVNIPWLRGPKALPLSLAPVATKIDFADAVRRRGRAVRRLVELASPRDDDERFLAWLQRDC